MKHLYFIFIITFFASCIHDEMNFDCNVVNRDSSCLSEEEAIDIALTYLNITRSSVQTDIYTEVITSNYLSTSGELTRAIDISDADTLMYLVKGVSTPVLLSSSRLNPIVYAIFDNPDISIIEILQHSSSDSYGVLSLLSNAFYSCIGDCDLPDDEDIFNPGEDSNPGSVTPVTVLPKVPVEWSQRAPFNRYCPTDCPAGCVAIAVAQAMMVTRHCDVFNGIELNYESLIRMKSCQDTILYPSQADTIAMLIRQIGYAVGMDYSPSGSGAQTSDAISIFTFGGRMNLSRNKRDIRATLQNYNDGIVIISSRTQTDFLGIPRGVGHCYLADGFKIYSNRRELIHVNFGQGPGNNGYYLTDLMAPCFTDNSPFSYPHEWKFYCLYNQ